MSLTGVNEDSVEPVADSFLHQFGSDRAVNAARDSPDLCTGELCLLTDSGEGNKAYNLGGVSNKLADANDLLLGEVTHLPVCASATDSESEIAKDFGASRCVRDLGVQLDAYFKWCQLAVDHCDISGNNKPKKGLD